MQIKGSCKNAKFPDVKDTDSFIFIYNEVPQYFTFEAAKLVNAVFTGTEFKGDLNCNESELYYTREVTKNFCSVKFLGGVYFNKAFVQKKIDFSESVFNQFADFSKINSIVDGLADLNYSGCTFSGRVLFDHSNLQKLNFNMTEFKDVVSFQYANIKNLTISRSYFDNHSDFLNAYIPNAGRETFRIIKHEFETLHSKVEVLHYHSKEMAAYKAELSFWKKPGDFILLWFNKYSNNYGLKWARGNMVHISHSSNFLHFISLES